MVSALSTKPKREGGTVGLAGGSVTPCSRWGRQRLASAGAWERLQERRVCPLACPARASSSEAAARPAPARWPAAAGAAVQLLALSCAVSHTGTDLRRLDDGAGAHRQRRAGGGPPRRRGAAAATGEAVGGMQGQSQARAGAGAANARLQEAQRIDCSSRLPPAAAAEDGAALQGGAEGGGHGCELRSGGGGARGRGPGARAAGGLAD